VNVNFGAIEAHLAASPMLILSDLTDFAPYTPYQPEAGDYGNWDACRAFE